MNHPMVEMSTSRDLVTSFSSLGAILGGLRSKLGLDSRVISQSASEDNLIWADIEKKSEAVDTEACNN